MTLEEISIRATWNPETNRWNYSVVDLIDTVVETADARNYWKVLKNRLKKKENQLLAHCNQLKLPSRDGKTYLTDVADKKTLCELERHLCGTNSPVLEHWINIIECSKPTKDALTHATEAESFPHQKIRNRLKSLFGF